MLIISNTNNPNPLNERMNPSAGEWKPSASAAAFVPGGAPPPPPSQAPPPPQKAESSMSDIDETDPLYQLVLKICDGDRDLALKKLSNPDSLTQYPEGEFSLFRLFWLVGWFVVIMICNDNDVHMTYV